MIYLRSNFRKGFIGYTSGTVKSKAKAGSVIAIYDGGVYDLTTFVTNNGFVGSPFLDLDMSQY